VDLTSVRQDPIAGFCDDGDEPSDSINAGNILTSLVTINSSGIRMLKAEYIMCIQFYLFL
jgi:hypothetical protein